MIAEPTPKKQTFLEKSSETATNMLRGLLDEIPELKAVAIVFAWDDRIQQAPVGIVCGNGKNGKPDAVDTNTLAQQCASMGKMLLGRFLEYVKLYREMAEIEAKSFNQRERANGEKGTTNTEAKEAG